MEGRWEDRRMLFMKQQVQTLKCLSVRFCKNSKFFPGMVEHTFNPSSWERGRQTLWVEGQPELSRETIPHPQITKQNKENQNILIVKWNSYKHLVRLKNDQIRAIQWSSSLQGHASLFSTLSRLRRWTTLGKGASLICTQWDSHFRRNPGLATAITYFLPYLSHAGINDIQFKNHNETRIKNK